jgi:L-ascorbate metabolism protein UlaG (beta-lactamase superfamily)
MGGVPVFLRPNVIVEPLVDGFYAWLHTVAPVQAAMNLAFLQVPLLESYLQSPQVHVAASVNPELRGGFFVNVPEGRAGEVRELLASIKRDRAGLLEFAGAVAAAEEVVRQGAAGFDLTPLYPRLPPVLSGLAELAYDTSNQASVRFIEPAVYRSPVLDAGRESVQLSLDSGVERPFILSTPRLPGPGVCDLRIPFAHRGLDVLFGARTSAVSREQVREALGADGEVGGFVDGLLAEDGPFADPGRHIGAGGRIRYFGHACLVLQSAGAAVMTDPWVTSDPQPGRFSYGDLPDVIDVVLITHGHQDHVVLETLLQLRGRVGVVVVPRGSKGGLCDPSLRLYLEHAGFTVAEVDDFSVVEFPGGRVTALPFLGEHADLDIRAKSTYCVQVAGRQVFVGADSSGIDPGLYRYMRAEVGRVDMAFLGMECAGAPLTWLYQALLTRPVTKKMSDSRTLSGSNAVQAAAIMSELGAAEAYVYAMGEESWLVGHVMATSYNEDSFQLRQVGVFLAWCAEHGIKAEHLYGQREWRWAEGGSGADY